MISGKEKFVRKMAALASSSNQELASAIKTKIFPKWMRSTNPNWESGDTQVLGEPVKMGAQDGELYLEARGIRVTQEWDGELSKNLNDLLESWLSH